jgi:hypothetical protein
VKIRFGFVSNSSSTSFVVIEKGDLELPHDFYDSELNIPQDFPSSYYEFGWGPGVHSDVGSKINWAVLQLLYYEEEDKLLEKAYQAIGSKGREFQLLEDVLKERFHISKVNFNLTTSYDEAKHNSNKIEAYIDHQSASCEDPGQMHIFDSKEKLEQFLFCPASFVEEDNDNR